MGQSTVRKGTSAETAKFKLNPTTKVFTEDGREVQPGSGEIGLVANGGMVPLGYYKDPEKSARTFREVNGVRYSFPGDMATVEADGTHHAARPRLELHQHRRREGLPRRGRGGAEGAPRGRGRARLRRPGRALRPARRRRRVARRRHATVAPDAILARARSSAWRATSSRSGSSSSSACRAPRTASPTMPPPNVLFEAIVG